MEYRRSAMTKSTSATTPTNVLLEARGITKSFPGVKALDGVGIAVHRGRLNALLGENGAGKSTLMNILAGVFPPDAGEILLDGRSTRFNNPREAQDAGISIIFQELNLIPQLSVAENIFLGREPLTRLGLVDYRRMNGEAKSILEKHKLDVDPRTPVKRLRVGEQQIVEIAKATSSRTRVLIMDEPTSAITEQEIEVLFRLIAQLKRQGVGIIYITHKLDELSQIADDVTVLRDGCLVASQSFAELTHDRIVQLMVGRDLADLYPKSAAPFAGELLAVEGITLRHPERADGFVVRDVSFSVRRGEVVGMFGLMGAGRTELLETIFGLHPRTSTGTIRVDGRQVQIRFPRQAIEIGLALAPEDRKIDGLVLLMSVAENIGLACVDQVTRAGIVSTRRERELARRIVDRLEVKTPSLGQAARNLSGGNQQKVVLAKWLATNPKVLLLDEPTRGIDINAKREIYAIVDELARSGLGVLMVSSELPETLAISDRILVLAEGRITAEFHRAEATEEEVLKAALPVAKRQRAKSA
jgi:ribose transport system ATP-binding protein